MQGPERHLNRDDPLAAWLVRWGLVLDGEPFTTRFGSRLAPVIADGAPAMLKVAVHEEERRGGALMAWWAGDGAAGVLAREGEAILLERACGPRSLADMARAGEDDAATTVLCEVAARLHAPRAASPPAELVPLDRWFRSLRIAAARDGGVFARALVVAERLLAAPRESVVLHGDLHHDNVLDGAARGWLAIDPKGLVGERGFEFANLFRNPDAALALEPGRMRRRAGIVAKLASLEPHRLVAWVFAYAALGAAWSIESGHDPGPGLAIAELAESQLNAEA